MRYNNRLNNQLREISFIPNYTAYAEGSILVSFGNTKVLCTASVLAGQVPKFLKNSGSGWLTAEYSMLPRATHTRGDREAVRGKQSGRTQEIQRLIGRALRASCNLKELGDNTIIIDCDVIQADGGTRTAAITGGSLSLYCAIQHLLDKKLIKKNPMRYLISAVSVGIYQGELLLDLDYQEDSNAEIDMNVVMDGDGNFVEIQGTAERKSMTLQQSHQLLDLAAHGMQQITAAQQAFIDSYNG